MARLMAKYREEIVPQLMEQLGRNNRLAVPRIEKVCLNMGVGAALEDSKLLESATAHMAALAGQAPAVTQARVSVANFKLRQGYKIGCRTTLRGRRMYEFLDRLINAAIPNIRDFRGLRRAGFDKQGNYSLGIDEITIFPEIDPDKVEQSQGMDVTFVVKNSEGREESLQLLKLLGMPFQEAKTSEEN